MWAIFLKNDMHFFKKRTRRYRKKNCLANISDQVCSFQSSKTEEKHDLGYVPLCDMNCRLGNRKIKKCPCSKALHISHWASAWCGGGLQPETDTVCQSVVLLSGYLVMASSDLTFSTFCPFQISVIDNLFICLCWKGGLETWFWECAVMNGLLQTALGMVVRGRPVVRVHSFIPIIYVFDTCNFMSEKKVAQILLSGERREAGACWERSGGCDRPWPWLLPPASTLLVGSASASSPTAPWYLWLPPLLRVGLLSVPIWMLFSFPEEQHCLLPPWRLSLCVFLLSPCYVRAQGHL